MPNVHICRQPKKEAYSNKADQVRYDRDYFENGIALGVSLYENYRWLPELTMRMAHFMVKRLEIEEGRRVLDLGCAKGYLVKALRLLNINAFGCDISEYAIQMADSEVKSYCRLSHTSDSIPFPDDWYFDWVIAKDVFEHIEEETLKRVLARLHGCSKRLFVVVPLGDNGRFVIPEYNQDETHVLARSARWWRRFFYAQGWFTNDFRHAMTALKENWARRYPQGNGLFMLERIRVDSERSALIGRD